MFTSLLSSCSVLFNSKRPPIFVLCVSDFCICNKNILAAVDILFERCANDRYHQTQSNGL